MLRLYEARNDAFQTKQPSHPHFFSEYDGQSARLGSLGSDRFGKKFPRMEHPRMKIRALHCIDASIVNEKIYFAN